MKTGLLKLSKAFLGTIILLGLPAAALAQVSLNNLDETYSQNFDGMGTSGTTFAPNWIGVKSSGTSATIIGAALPLLVTDGSANSGAVYNVGTSSTTDRAFGTLASGGNIPRFGASFINNTGQTITSVNLKGIMEQWRSGSSNTINETIIFEYSLAAPNIMEGNWTALPAFNLVEKLTDATAAAAVVGNADANKTNLSAQINNIAWPAGATLWIRWTDKDDTGSDGLYALDDFELTPSASGNLPADTTPPTLSTTNPFSPADNTASVNINTSLTLTFNENVKAGTGDIILNNLTDGTSQTFAVSNTPAVGFNGATVTLAGAALNHEKSYAVQIPAGVVTDLAGNAFAGFTGNTAWNFTTGPAPIADNGTALTALDVAYIQNFDGMGPATGSSLPANWLAIRAGGTGLAKESLNPVTNNGATTSGAIYNVGTTGAPDRALGTLSSGSTIPAFGAFFTNNTGKIITSVDLSGALEQWKSGSNNTVNEVVNFEYSLNATSLSDGTWIRLSNLDLTEILTTTTTAAAVDGNTHRAELTGTITNIGWRAGNNLWIRWTDNDDSGSDGMYALDDFQLTPRAVADITAPALAATNPLQPQTGELLADHEANLVISFSEIIQSGTGAITVKNISDHTEENIPLSAVTVDNNRASFLANLLPGKSYEITVATGVFEDLAENKFAGIAPGTWTFTTVIPNPYAQNFNRCESNLPGGWTQYSTVGETEFWGCSTFGRTGNAVQMNGFNSGNKQNEDWLISPAYDLSTGFNYPLLSFWSRTRFAGESLKLMVSTDYSGSGNPAAATWKEINGIFPALDSDTWTLSENINLSKFKGSAVYIAFVYTSTTSSASRWTLDDVAITNSETEPVTPVFFVSSLSPISNFDFGYVTEHSATAAKAFTFYALDLKSNLTVTAPAGFELSRDNTAFAAALTYTPEQTFDNSTIYVRFKNDGDTPAAFAGSIRFTSGDFNIQRGYLTATTLDKDKTLDVITWNIEWFGNTGLGPDNEALQLENAKKLILAQDAEVYCVEEIANPTAFKELVKQLPGYKGFLSPYVSGSAGDNSQRVGFIYKTSAIDSVTTRGLLQSPANPSNFWASGRLPYLFVADATVAGVKKRLHLIAIHAKANENGSAADARSAYDRRISDLKVLKDSLDLYYPEANIMMLGDFNDDVDFTVANVPTTESTYKIFIDDTADYRAVTKDLSDAGLRTYITFDNVIDHVVISGELYPDYLANSAKVIIPFDLIADYANTTSDHLPVSTRFVLQPNVSFAGAAANVAEEAGIYNLNLHLSRPSLTAQTVTFTVQPGTSVTSADYAIETYSVTVPAGVTTTTLPVTILDDNLVELSETLTFAVADVTGSLGFTNSNTFSLTIQDNDKSKLNFSTNVASVSENAGAYKVTLNLDQAPVVNQAVIISLANSSGATYGTAPGSYTTLPAAIKGELGLTIPAGATSVSFTVQLTSDSKKEANKIITFGLKSLGTSLVSGNPATFTLTVLDATDPNVGGVYGGEIQVAPNPSSAASGPVSLLIKDAAASNAQDLTLTLWNNQGQQLLSASGTLETITHKLNQQLVTLPAAMYILKVVHGSTYYNTRLIRE